MEISEKTIDALEKVICGNPYYQDKAHSPYKTGKALIEFFNRLGSDDEYRIGFPPRWQYAKEKLREFNNSPAMVKIVEAALDPREFLGTTFDVKEAVAYINQFIYYEGYEVRKIGDYYKVFELNKELVEISNPFNKIGLPNHQYVLEQIDKCKQKISDNDYDGAITNARSLLEAVFLDMEELLTGKRQKYDGNLNKLYKRIRKLLNLEPSHPDLTNSLRELLSGLISIVSALGSIRNKMSDAHARTYKPEKRHAQLAVNASRTVVDFIFETFEYQLNQGIIKIDSQQDDN